MSLTRSASISIIMIAATLANLPAQLRAEDPWEQVRRDTEKNPDEVIGCGAGASDGVYTTRAICFAVMKLARDRKIEYSAANELLQMCSSLSTSICLVMVKEVQHLSDKARSVSKYVLVNECASDIEQELPGNEKPQYLNACDDLMRLFH